MIPLREPKGGKQAALANIYDGALQVVYDIMEDICTESENELLGEQPWSEEVKGKHAIAHAQNAMLVRLAEVVDFHVAELRGGEKRNSLAQRRGLR